MKPLYFADYSQGQRSIATKTKAPNRKDLIMRYHITFTDNQGNFAADAIAETVGGTVISNTDRFDGVHDVAIIDVTNCDLEHLESVLDADKNVISYKSV